MSLLNLSLLDLFISGLKCKIPNSLYSQASQQNSQGQATLLLMLILFGIGLFIVVTGLAFFLARKEIITEEMNRLLDEDAEFLNSISDEGAVFIIEDVSATAS